MATVSKGDLGEQDIHKWSGTTADKTFTRAASTGGTLTLNSVGYEVDALITYGGGVNYTQATIQDALTAIGTTDKVTLLLRPSTWVISSNADWSAYTNVTFKIVPGAKFSGAFTLNIPNIDAGRYQIFDSTLGAVTLSGNIAETYPEWWYASGDYYTAFQAAITTGLKVSMADNKTYPVGTGLSVVTDGQIIEGQGDNSVIKATAAIELITVSTPARRVRIRNLKLDGDSTATKGIVGKYPDGHIEGNRIVGFTTAGVSLEGVSGFTWKISKNRIIDNTGNGITVGYGSNDIHITENVISSNSKHGVETIVVGGYPSSIYITGNDMENNCAAGSVATPYAHIMIGGGTHHTVITGNYFESDIDQIGYASQLYILVGAGADSVKIRDNRFGTDVTKKFDYYIALGVSATSIEITGNNFTPTVGGWNNYVINNALGEGSYLSLENNMMGTETTLISSTGRELSAIPWISGYGTRLTVISKIIDLSSAAKTFTIFLVPNAQTFLPISVQARADNDIAATTGNYWSVGVSAANRRVDYGVCTTAAAASKHSGNAKIRWLNSSELANQVAEAGDTVAIISVADKTDGAALADNIGGAAGDAITVVIYGWLISDLPNL